MHIIIMEIHVILYLRDFIVNFNLCQTIASFHGNHIKEDGLSS